MRLALNPLAPPRHRPGQLDVAAALDAGEIDLALGIAIAVEGYRLLQARRKAVAQRRGLERLALAPVPERRQHHGRRIVGRHRAVAGIALEIRLAEVAETARTSSRSWFCAISKPSTMAPPRSISCSVAALSEAPIGNCGACLRACWTSLATSSAPEMKDSPSGRGWSICCMTPAKSASGLDS